MPRPSQPTPAFKKILQRILSTGEQGAALLYTLKWLLFFLVSIDWVTNYREANTWIVTLLPLGGLIIGLLYHYPD
jgi:uncharacterized membrane protein